MKTHRARLIHVDGRDEIIEQAEPFTLTQLQGWVGGYIEDVKTRPPVRTMFVNEDAIAQGLPVNPTATALIDTSRYAVRAPGVRGLAVVILRKADTP